MWSTLAVLIVGTFISILNSSLINIALPKMMAVFGVSLNSIQWVVTAYTIALGAVIPLSGYLSDLLGSKKTYIGALAMFTLGSIACGLAWNNTSMIAFRIIQGIGGGIIGPVGNAIIFKTVPAEKRGMAMGIYGIAAMAAPAIGPTLGGYIIEHLTWRMLFFISVPFGVVGVLMGIVMMDEIPKNPLGDFDTIGFITSTIGLVSLFYVMGKWNSIDWTSMEYPILMAVGVSCLILFAVNEWMHPHPLLNLKVFKIYSFSIWCGLLCILSMSMMGITYIIPIFTQNILGYTAMQTGILLFPAAIVTGMMMPISGKIFDQYGHLAIMVIGLGILILSNYLFVFLNLNTSTDTIRFLLILRAIGLGMAFMPPMTLSMEEVPPALISHASALSNIIRQVSSAVSVALITTLLQRGITIKSAEISNNISAMDPNVVDCLKGLKGFFSLNGYTAQDASTLSLTVLSGQIQKQAYVDSMDGILWLMLFAAILALALVILNELYHYFKRLPKDEGYQESQ